MNILVISLFITVLFFSNAFCQEKKAAPDIDISKPSEASVSAPVEPDKEKLVELRGELEKAKEEMENTQKIITAITVEKKELEDKKQDIQKVEKEAVAITDEKLRIQKQEEIKKEKEWIVDKEREIAIRERDTRSELQQIQDKFEKIQQAKKEEMGKEGLSQQDKSDAGELNLAGPEALLESESSAR